MSITGWTAQVSGKNDRVVPPRCSESFVAPTCTERARGGPNLAFFCVTRETERGVLPTISKQVCIVRMSRNILDVHRSMGSALLLLLLLLAAVADFRWHTDRRSLPLVYAYMLLTDRACIKADKDRVAYELDAHDDQRVAAVAIAMQLTWNSRPAVGSF